MYFKIEQSIHTLKTILSYFCLIYLFSLGWVFLAVLAFSSYCEWGLLSSWSFWASHCCGFSCCEAQALGTRASVVAACGLSRWGSPAPEKAGFCSCGSWDLPRPGIRSPSSPLTGGSLSTVAPGKSQSYLLCTELTPFHWRPVLIFCLCLLFWASLSLLVLYSYS